MAVTMLTKVRKSNIQALDFEAQCHMARISALQITSASSASADRPSYHDKGCERIIPSQSLRSDMIITRSMM